MTGGQAEQESTRGVPTQKLQPEPQGCIAQQIAEHQLSRAFPLAKEPKQQKEQPQLAPGLHQLHREPTDVVDLRHQRISRDRKTPPAGDAIAAAPQKASHPAKGVERGNGAGEQIGEQTGLVGREAPGVPVDGQAGA